MPFAHLKDMGRSSGEERRNMKSLKVLLVDDDEKLTYIIKEMLESQGYETRIARDAGDGYLTYLLFRPDLVITDLQMPGKNGLELMRRIRRVNDPKVRTIYMSGDLSQFGSVLEEEKERHEVGLLQKPFSKIELMRLVSGHDFLKEDGYGD